MEKHIYFVRHGESDSNSDGIFRGTESQLSEKGLAQARAVAERVARLGVETIISSSFPRALATARAIAEKTGLSVEISDLFVERRRPSSIYKKRYDEPEVVETTKAVFEGYAKTGFRHSDEENLDDLSNRAREALEYLKQRSETRICVVTHAFFLRVLFATILAGGNLSGDDLQRVSKALVIDNTGITYARFEQPHFSYPQGTVTYPWLLVSWNDSSHLG